MEDYFFPNVPWLDGNFITNSEISVNHQVINVLYIYIVYVPEGESALVLPVYYLSNCLFEVNTELWNFSLYRENVFCIYLIFYPHSSHEKL